MSFLLVYSKNGSSILDFVNGIDCSLRAHFIDVILGDLNINFFNTIDVQPLTNLRTFALIVSAHPYCARKFARQVMHERARVVIK